MAVVAAVVVVAVHGFIYSFELGTYLRIFDGRLVATTIGLVAKSKEESLAGQGHNVFK